MPLVSYAIVIALIAAAATVAAMLGIGGGSLYTPLQVLFGIDMHEAATSSLALILVISLTATRTFHRAGKIDWGLAIVLEIVTVIGSILAGYFSGHIPARVLTITLIVVLIIVGLTMLFLPSTTKTHLHHDKGWYHWRRPQGYTINLLVALPLSIVAGVLSGLLGIGGGIVKVPLMVMILGIPMHTAVATSAFMVGITALGGFAGHAFAGHVNWKFILIAAPAVLIGAWIGAHIMLKTPKQRLKKIFGIVVIIVAGLLIIRLI